LNNLIGQQSERIMNLVQTARERADTLPGIGALIETVRAYSEDRCSILAASLSYYTLLSIFPLMLFLLTVASTFIPIDRVVREISGFFSANLPSSTAMLRTSLEEIVRLRGATTLIAAVGFVWSASGVFDVIQLSINRAFRVQHPRPVWRQRLVSLMMVIGVSLLFGLSVILTTGIRLAYQYRLLERHSFWADALPILGAIIVSTAVFGLLYRYIPYDPAIRWRDVWLGAVLAAALWEIAKLVFTWYMTSYALLNLVYGSVGTIIAIMLWGYITAAILMLGAEFTAVRAGARQRAKHGDEWWALVSQ
jgi:membrane protein